MKESCNCYFGERPAEECLELISEISGSSMYLCSHCRASWERSGSGDWDLFQAPVPILPVPELLTAHKATERPVIDYDDVEISESGNWPQRRRNKIKEGEMSFFRNEGRLKNPYLKDSLDNADFERGWIQAQKKNWNLYSDKDRATLSDKYGSKRKRQSVILDSSYNAYAEAKGKE